jgi:hypothetical protein
MVEKITDFILRYEITKLIGGTIFFAVMIALAVAAFFAVMIAWMWLMGLMGWMGNGH